MSCLIKTSSEYDRVNGLIVETVSLLCKNGLSFTKQLKVQGVLAVTIDENEIFLVHINEAIDYSPEEMTPKKKKKSLQPAFKLFHEKNYNLLGNYSDYDEDDHDDEEAEEKNEEDQIKTIKAGGSKVSRNEVDNICNFENNENNFDIDGGSEISEIKPMKDDKERSDDEMFNEKGPSNDKKNMNTDIINNNTFTNNTKVNESLTNEGNNKNNENLDAAMMSDFLIKTEIIDIKSDDESQDNIHHNTSIYGKDKTLHSIYGNDPLSALYANNNNTHSPSTNLNDLQCTNNNINLSDNINDNIFNNSDNINDNIFNNTDNTLFSNNKLNNSLNNSTSNSSNIDYHFQNNPLNFQPQNQYYQVPSMRKRRVGFLDTRPFACPVQGCDRRFFHRNNVYRHRKQKHYI